jgi:hypothetical protein
MVSRNLGPIDGRLMQWEGFDLVADDVEELDGELAHYAAHLERPDARCGPNCDLGEEP